MLRHVYTGLLMLGVAAASAHAAVPQECDVVESPRGKNWEIGLVFQSLTPGGLPGVSMNVPVFGPVFGIPVIGGTLQFQGGVGSSSELNLYLLEADYRLELSSPYISAFALFGVHYLHYSLDSGNHFGGGTNLGLGVSFLMGEGFELSFSLRTYLQARSTISFGGGFSFLL